MNGYNSQHLRSIRDVREQAESLFAGWIKINDIRSRFTIEDFPYDGGVPDEVERHCWRCITVNQCWFVDRQGKKPEEFGYENYTVEQIPKQTRGLCHPHCHCKKEVKSVPGEENIELIPLGKFTDFFTRKKGIFYGMGYTDDDKDLFVKIFCSLVKKSYVQAKYNVFAHDKAGFKINCLIDLPGAGVKKGRIYHFKSGWTIFSNGKLKANTIHAGWRERQ